MMVRRIQDRSPRHAGLAALLLVGFAACGGDASLEFTRTPGPLTPFPSTPTNTVASTRTPTELATASPTMTDIVQGELAETIAADATQLTIDAPTGSIPAAGVLQIDDERIGYTAVTDNGDGTFTLTGLLRGADGTAATSHSAGSLVFVLAAAATATPVDTATPTNEPSSTPTEIPTRTPTEPATEVPTRTPTDTPAATATATYTPSEVPTATHTATRTSTPSHTFTPTPTQTNTPTQTATVTLTPTATPSATPSLTPTEAVSNTPTLSPTATSTQPTATPTATAVATDTPMTTCGNGLLEPGEFVDDPENGEVGDLAGVECPEDAVVEPCTPAQETKVFEIDFEAAIGTVPTSTTVLVGYRSGLLHIPGSGTDRDVRGRVAVAPPPPFISTPTDFDYALRLIVVRTSPLAEGLLAAVTFDRCEGAAEPQAADLACYVEGCSGAGGTIQGCTCTVIDPNAPDTPTPTSPPTASATMPPQSTPTATETPSPTAADTSTPTAAPSDTPTLLPSATPTATNVPATDTPTATLEPTEPAGPVCGNGFLEAGENYTDPTVGLVGDPNGTSCPEDAVIGSCAAATQVPFQVEFNAAIGTIPTSTTVLVGYRSELVSIPGSGAAREVRGRVAVAPPPPFISTPNDYDYALRLIVVRTSPLAEGLLATVTFDTCSAAEAPTAADFGCAIEGCSGQGGPIEGCTCRVVATQ